MKPYKFEPYFKTTVWGGDQIAPFKGIETARMCIGESWEISAVPGHESILADRGIVNDVDLGLTLTQLIDKYKGLLLGERNYEKFGNRFPLLIKFIDSRQDLSVQVHPDDKLAMERHQCAGKTEMWYIMKSNVGSKIYAGLSKNISPDDYERLVNEPIVDGHSPMQDVIATHESHQGDLFYLPAGRLHAIGAGNFLVEIQETSDITYRVFDFGRKDANGNPRELHIEQAKDAIDYRVWPEYRTSYDSTRANAPLVHCQHFKVNRVVVQQAAQIEIKGDSFVVVICIAGHAVINGVETQQGETLLVPGSENTLYIFGDATFLTATV